MMVEHFTDAVLGKARLMYPPGDSICNMRVLDALAQAARSGETIKL
jgi:predicted dehydrogenase